MTYAPPCDRAIAAETLRSGHAVWLLTVEVAGRTLRYSSRPVVVGDRVYRGGLSQVRADQALDLLQQDPQAPSVSVGIIADEPFARWVSYGHRLDQSDAELAWYVEGSAWEERQVIVRGPLLAGAYGASGEPMTAVIEPQTQGDGSTVAPLRFYTGDIEESQGEPYPLVFGRPYVLRKGTASPIAPSRAPIATKAVRWTVTSGTEEAREILICYGHVPDCEAIEVHWRDTADPADEGSVELAGEDLEFDFDDDGEPITLMDTVFSGLTAAQREAKEWYVQWTDCTGGLTRTQGAIEGVVSEWDAGDPPVDQTVATLRAGDVIESVRWTTVVEWSASATGSVDLQRSTPYNLLTLTSADLNTTGTYSDREGVRANAAATINFQLNAPSATTAEGVLRINIRRAARPGDTITTLGELAQYLVEKSGQRTDLGAWSAMIPDLAVPVGGVLDASRLAWETLQRDVLPLAPVSLRTGPQGIVPVLWRWWASADDAEAQLTVGRDGLVRLPDVRSARPDSEVITRAVVRYGHDALADDYLFVLTLGGGNIRRNTSQFRRHNARTLDSAVSGQIYGRRDLRLDSRFVYETATAAWWARWRLAAEGWAHRLVDVEGGQHLGSLMPGDVVTLTDDSVFLSSAVALVLGRQLTDVGRVSLSLALVDGLSSIRTTAGPTADSGTPSRPGGPTPDPQQ